MDWKTCNDDRERYLLYLNSREWSEKKQAVKKRSNHKCERCLYQRSENVHHLTYARKYHEDLDDLQDLCRQCHEFIHGRIDVDPIRNRPILVDGAEVKYVYLAGKICRQNYWRDSILGFSNETGQIEYREWWSTGINAEAMRRIPNSYIPKCCPIPDGTLRALNFRGPVRGWQEDHAPFHVHADDYYALDWQDANDIQTRCLNQIRRSDLVFCWIEAVDCFGTIAEIGFAKALKKVIVIAVSHSIRVDDLWFPLHMANTSFFAESAKEAWHHLWNRYCITQERIQPFHYDPIIYEAISQEDYKDYGPDDTENGVLKSVILKNTP